MKTTEERWVELRRKIVGWAASKNIFKHSDALKQVKKLTEEVSELTEEICIAYYAEEMVSCVEEELGDCLVVLTIIASMYGLTPEECLETSYNKISKRKGKMIDGLFVKEE